MMKNMLVGLGMVVANLGGAAALAGQSPVVVIGEPQPAATRYVSYADLDLASRDGERALIRRLRSAVNQVCAEELGSSAIVYVKISCRKLTWNDTEPQFDRAISRARQMAEGGTSSVAAAAIVVRAAR